MRAEARADFAAAPLVGLQALGGLKRGVLEQVPLQDYFPAN